MEESKKEARGLIRDAYLSWMAEAEMDKKLEAHRKRQFGLGAFLFYFGASLLGSCVAQILSRCFA